MLFIFSCFLLFFLIVLLIHYYHSYNWNNTIDSIDKVWISPFECGFLNYSSPYSSFTYGFISFLIIFVLFDLEVSLFINFCYSINVYSNFFYYYLFLFVLCLGYCLEVLMGIINWMH
uniref:NADH-ubiquinone oxidoreductase chain 3 n=1 Tax=Cichlidarus nyanzae TaxID=608002 RepID=A0A2Z4GPH4_9PLAT|nr:NADH dehydrogenase subunit 3 [Gyrodactylus nyanzae]AWW03130.1 NADH dehydrogenase subunit 3 [Gyrodactylus nyanzae]